MVENRTWLILFSASLKSIRQSEVNSSPDHREAIARPSGASSEAFGVPTAFARKRACEPLGLLPTIPERIRLMSAKLYVGNLTLSQASLRRPFSRVEVRGKSISWALSTLCHDLDFLWPSSFCEVVTGIHTSSAFIVDCAKFWCVWNR